MEQLLQLLKEFYPVDWWDKEYYIENSMVYVRDYDDDDIFNYEIFTLNIISKKFWFIQWLVDNDKIDIQWAKNLLYESEIFNPLPYTDLSERLIMYLAIQDGPISFLVSILK